MRLDVNACFGHWPYWDLHHKSPEDLLGSMDRNGIDRAVVMSLRGLFIDWRQGNDETLMAAGNHTGRLIPAATISPFLEGTVKDVNRLADAGVRIIRLYPSFHNYALDSGFTDSICRAAAERGITVSIPTRPMMNWRFKAIPIEAIGAIVDRHPRTTFLMSGPNYLVEFQALVLLMRRCRNVVYEISCVQGHNAVRSLIDQVGADRLLFGTGAVLHYPACNVAKLDGAEISEEQRLAIAHRNAERLLNPGS
jgi:predicted TIM-barrel fold metal-dependent hydrolase